MISLFNVKEERERGPFLKEENHCNVWASVSVRPTWHCRKFLLALLLEWRERKEEDKKMSCSSSPPLTFLLVLVKLKQVRGEEEEENRIHLVSLFKHGVFLTATLSNYFADLWSSRLFTTDDGDVYSSCGFALRAAHRILATSQGVCRITDDQMHWFSMLEWKACEAAVWIWSGGRVVRLDAGSQAAIRPSIRSKDEAAEWRPRGGRGGGEVIMGWWTRSGVSSLTPRRSTRRENK